MTAVDFDDGQFIELVQQYPLIWNGRHPDHRNRLKLENAWSTITEFMGTTVEFCEKRWATIRHRFAKERRLAQKPSGSASYTITWPYYSACSFLEDVVRTRRTVSNMKKYMHATATVVTNPLEQAGKLWDVGHDFSAESGSEVEMKHDITVLEESHAELEHPTFMSGGDETTGSSSRLSMLRQPKTSKRKWQGQEEGAAIAELSPTITSAIQDIEGLSSSLDDPEVEDEDFVFGKTVAVMLKDVKGKKRKALLKAKIITLIAEATDDDL